MKGDLVRMKVQIGISESLVGEAVPWKFNQLLLYLSKHHFRFKNILKYFLVKKGVGKK